MAARRGCGRGAVLHTVSQQQALARHTGDALSTPAESKQEGDLRKEPALPLRAAFPLSSGELIQAGLLPPVVAVGI